MMKIILCFNCSRPISKKAGTQTREHIPIQSLFEGLGPNFKIDRITVPCCYECNNSTSKTLDEEFRNAIALLSDSPRLTGPAVRSILKYKKEFDRVSLDEIGRRGISFETKNLIDYLEKVFKGLFYQEYSYPLPAEFSLYVDYDQSKKEFSKKSINYLIKNYEFKHSGHPSIFKYILQPFRENLNQGVKRDSTPTPNDNIYLAFMVFSSVLPAMVYARSKSGQEVFQ